MEVRDEEGTLAFIGLGNRLFLKRGRKHLGREAITLCSLLGLCVGQIWLLATLKRMCSNALLLCLSCLRVRYQTSKRLSLSNV